MCGYFFGVCQSTLKVRREKILFFSRQQKVHNNGMLLLVKCPCMNRLITLTSSKDKNMVLERSTKFPLHIIKGWVCLQKFGILYIVCQWAPYQKKQGSCTKIKGTLLNSVISTSLMSFLFLYPEILGNGCFQCKSHFLLSHFSPIYHRFWHCNELSKSSNSTLTCITLSSL